MHAEAPSAAQTDWRQITVLYELLERVAPNPLFTLNRAVAVAVIRGPVAGLDLLSAVEQDARRPPATACPPSAATCWSSPATSPRRPPPTRLPLA